MAAPNGAPITRGAHPDGSFTRAWRGLFVVAVNCTEPGAAAFLALALRAGKDDIRRFRRMRSM